MYKLLIILFFLSIMAIASSAVALVAKDPLYTYSVSAVTISTMCLAYTIYHIIKQMFADKQ